MDQATPSAETEEQKALKKKLKKDQKDAKKAEKLEKFEQKKAKEEHQKKAPPTESQTNKEEAPEKKIVVTYTIPTPKGQKKDILCPMPESYSPQYVEAAWNEWWMNRGYFTPDFARKSGKPLSEKYVCAYPPPNVTGSLHIGHALTISIEDSVARWHRMCGHEVLWNPGCDHAGIATQVVVEKKVWREQQKSRHDLGREAFVEEVWKWKREKGDRIYQQMMVLGCSCDWSRARFTMDPMLSRAVREAFIRLHEEGYIYRANRLVNWSCTLMSAISDIEVEKTELEGRTLLRVPGYDEKVEFGVLVSFAYQIEDGSGEIVVSTTRVETMLGDTAIAVHPLDERYKHLHGKRARHPFSEEPRFLPIVCDEYVDREFGTGAVKITPAHDPNDFELGARHKLPSILMLDDKGIIPPGFGKFSGMKRFHARKAVLEALKGLGLYRNTVEHKMTVPICSRSKDIIEPLPKPQWYVRCSEMAAASIDAVRSGKLAIVPAVFEKIWYNWMENCRDWCISRQLWWGHRIPAYYVTLLDEKGDPIKRSFDEENQYWVSGRTEAEAREKASKKFGVPPEKFTLRWDEDVLDTWFSSALFPFSIFGWPQNELSAETNSQQMSEALAAARSCWSDLARYFPTSILETAHDILFFWVARMVMMGWKLTGSLPFHTVLLHPIIRDKFGEKMSKSKGNVIDPLDVVSGISLAELNAKLDRDTNLDLAEVTKAKEGQKIAYPKGIPECGADALRLALAAYTSPSSAATGGAYCMNVDVDRVNGYRHFANKIWNACRFLLIHALGEEGEQDVPPFTPNEKIVLTGKESEMDLWILSRLAFCVSECESGFARYEFSAITTSIYSFWLYEMCDYYIEYAKPFLLDYSSSPARARRDEDSARVRGILYACLHAGLRLLSPFMPFLTEELYQRLLLAGLRGPAREKAASENESICVQDYPRPDSYRYRDEGVEKRVDLMQSVVRAIRSVKGDYQLQKRVKPTVTLHVPHPSAAQAGSLDEAAVLEPYIQSGVIANLAQCGDIKLKTDSEAPSAHAASVQHMTPNCTIYVHLEGMLNASKELGKAREALEKARKQLAELDAQKVRWAAAESGAGGEASERVPLAVRKAHEEKSAAVHEEMDKLEHLAKLLEQLSIEQPK